MRMGTFFSFLQKKNIFPKMDNIFLPNQKKIKRKTKCGLPTGFNNGHPLDRKQKFFLGWPEHSHRGIYCSGKLETTKDNSGVKNV